MVSGTALWYFPLGRGRAGGVSPVSFLYARVKGGQTVWPQSFPYVSTRERACGTGLHAPGFSHTARIFFRVIEFVFKYFVKVLGLRFLSEIRNLFSSQTSF